MLIRPPTKGLVRSSAPQGFGLPQPRPQTQPTDNGGGGGGGDAYVARWVHLDGHTWLYSLNALGAINGPKGIFSYWGRQAASGELTVDAAGVIDTGSSGAFILQAPGGVGTPNANSTGLTFSPDGVAFTTFISLYGTTDIPVGSKFHVLFAWDFNFAGPNKRVACYVNDVLVPFDATAYFNNDGSSSTGSWPANDPTPAFDIGYNDTLWSIGHWGYDATDASSHIPSAIGDLSDLYMNTVETIVEAGGTISEANRRKFIGPSGEQVFLGAHGELPTGSRPLICLSGGADTFADNVAGTGSFQVIGTLTDAA